MPASSPDPLRFSSRDAALAFRESHGLDVTPTEVFTSGRGVSWILVFPVPEGVAAIVSETDGILLPEW